MSPLVKRKLPNLLTSSRGVIIILISLLFFSNYSHRYILSLALFVAALTTDYLDGKLARSWNTKSNFGIVFDSLFDKILTIDMYLLLAPYNLIHPGVYIALVIRDLFVDGIKNYSLSQGKPIPAIKLGKYKMVSQVSMITTALILLILPSHDFIKYCLLLTAGASLFFSYFSGAVYVLDWISYQNERSHTKK